MAEHPSGLPNAIDRAIGKRNWRGVLHYDGQRILQIGELNEAQTIARSHARRVGNLIARDGDRYSGAEAVVDQDAGTVTLTAGEIYIDGDVFPVAEATLADVQMEGRVEIGVRLLTAWITHEDDPELLGQAEGALEEGEPGAAREVASLVWALPDDGGDGQFAAVYLLIDGTLVDQAAPPILSEIQQSLSVYDYGAHGHYIVEGCSVAALGKTGDAQVFAIEAGEANIHGFKRRREAGLRLTHVEDFDVIAVPGETHAIASAGAEVLTMSAAPIAEVTSIFLTKQKTATVTRGVTANGEDALPDTSLVAIIEVTQGATTFVADTDHTLSGNNVSWAPAGAEPAGGSSYDVTYWYRDAVTPDSYTATTVTISGGVAGGEALVSYTYKLPRIDLICLDQDGAPAYVKGASGSSFPPPPPTFLLKLAEVHNDWFSTPVIKNNGTHNTDFDEIARMKDELANLIRLAMIERSRAAIDAREPVAKKGMFVDPFVDDTYRDQGEAQTAAIGNGMLTLAHTPTIHTLGLMAPVTLDYVEEVIIAQELDTACVLINPYQNFTPLPASMALTPAADFWSISETQWASDVTREFNRGNTTNPEALEQITQSTEIVGVSGPQNLPFLREIDVDVHIEGMGSGENLEMLSFDSLDVKPAGVQTADAAGDLDVTFTIPAGVTAGSKSVEATGEGGSEAAAIFTGQGVINITTMRRVTTIERWNLQQTGGGGGGGIGASTTGWAGGDPQAQTFIPHEIRQTIGMDFKICAVGDPGNDLIIEQVRVENGWPTRDVEAQAHVDMAGAETGWKQARFGLPLTTTPDREHAFVIRTDDGAHSVSVANLGDFDAQGQQWITARPYPIGVRLSSVNATTWTAHQDSVLTFRTIAASYTATEKVVDLGEVDLVNCSDLVIRAAVELPSGDCGVRFEIERANGDIITLLAGQVVRLAEFVTETVEVRAILTGTAKLSPILFAPVQLIAAKIATEGTYVTRAFTCGAARDLGAYFKAFKPSGASVSIFYDLADDDWQALPLIETEALAFPNWTEPKHQVEDITSVNARIKLVLTGGPAARPIVGDLGAWVS
ncbi:MAG: DUF4815 domain-containing protein [Alphaproteobacteria bacterium]|nr:DUF4815 domain-containing protein [Alphaproteobacteria bacterium]